MHRLHCCLVQIYHSEFTVKNISSFQFSLSITADDFKFNSQIDLFIPLRNSSYGFICINIMNLKHKYVQLNLLKTCLTRFELRYKMIVVIPHEIIHRLFLSFQLLPNYICFFYRYSYRKSWSFPTIKRNIYIFYGFDWYCLSNS